MILQMDGEHPSPYRIERAVGFLNEGGVLAIPTDTTYSLACRPDRKAAVDRLRALRRLDASKPLALIFSDLRHVSEHTLVDDQAFRVLRRLLPGPYCFILEANRKLPRFIGDKRKRVGIRVPNHAIPQALVSAVGLPLIVTSAIDPESGLTLFDPWTVESTFGHALSAVLDGGDVPGEFSSVVDLTGDEAKVIREGLGDCAEFL
ncbi:MAG: tRNA threonylcarbamoyl adenosine modification protein (Sua5/YciO/YrdC/YwlC family) [Bradymonadia bacterium]|jgi:tRNA threonylcarbamoyl adenosine modification protein (Sua5/YciO/YrdC/YwlC family)